MYTLYSHSLVWSCLQAGLQASKPETASSRNKKKKAAEAVELAKQRTMCVAMVVYRCRQLATRWPN